MEYMTEKDSCKYDVRTLERRIAEIASHNTETKCPISWMVSDIAEIAEYYVNVNDVHDDAVKVLNTITELRGYRVTKEALYKPVNQLINSLNTYIESL